MFPFALDVAMQDRSLKPLDVGSDRSDGLKIILRDVPMGVRYFLVGNPKSLRRDIRSIESSCVCQNSFGTFGSNFVANPFDNLLRTQRLAK
jgi:hypothetical protein